MNNIFYITYDGLSDPLGQSQILPYLIEISKHQKSLRIISFEKKNNLKNYEKDLSKILKENNIIWHRLNYTNGFKRFGRAYDFTKLFLYTYFFLITKNINIIHLRGFIPSLPIFFLNIIFNSKYIYDSRGMWVDERIDNGSLIVNNFIDNLIYKILKKIEYSVFKNAAHVIVLTRKAKRILEKYNNIKNISIIPCNADYDYFDIKNIKKSDNQIKKQYNIPLNKKIIIYTGSTKGVYLFEEMLKFFDKVIKYNDDFIFLIISNDYAYSKLIINKEFNKISKKLILIQGLRHEMPLFYKISDLMISFIKPSFARKSSSPTKIAEALSSNLPILSNKGVGDIDLIIKKFNAGKTISLNNIDEVDMTAKNVKMIINNKEPNIRLNSKHYFSLKIANEVYKKIYLKFKSMSNK